MKKLLLVALALLLSTFAFAGAPGIGDPSYAAWEFTTNGNSFTNGNWTFGEVFVPNNNVLLDYLGYYGTVGGFNSDHPVGIFDANGNLLRSTVINNASSAFSTHFVYNPVAPLALLAGQTYVIEGVSSSDPYTWNDPGFAVYADIIVLGNNWILGNGLNFNGTFLINDVTDGYWGANFGWATPEPGSLLLLGTGIAGLAGALRRKLF